MTARVHRRRHSAPRCLLCGQRYEEAQSCTVEDDRLLFGQEEGGNPDLNPDLHPDLDPDTIACRDCNVRWGDRHHYPCWVAICALCGLQDISHNEEDCDAERQR